MSDRDTIDRLTAETKRQREALERLYRMIEHSITFLRGGKRIIETALAKDGGQTQEDDHHA